MKIVAMIPYWSGYDFPNGDIEKRDVIKLGAHSLINYTVSLANRSKMINEVIIYSSSNDVMNDISLEEGEKCRLLKRDSELDDQSISIETIIERFLEVSDADIVVLMHPKNPFLKPQTVDKCIKNVLSKEYDSAFIVTRIKKLAWYKNKPVNYSLDKDTPNHSSLAPVFLESSSLYVFSRELFENTHSRIGEKFFMCEIDPLEGFEINQKDDYAIAELIINAGLI